MHNEQILNEIRETLDNFYGAARYCVMHQWRQMTMVQRRGAVGALMLMRDVAQNPGNYFSRNATINDWQLRSIEYIQTENGPKLARIYSMKVRPGDRLASRVGQALDTTLERKFMFSNFCNAIVDWEYGRTSTNPHCQAQAFMHIDKVRDIMQESKTWKKAYPKKRQKNPVMDAATIEEKPTSQDAKQKSVDMVLTNENAATQPINTVDAPMETAPRTTAPAMDKSVLTPRCDWQSVRVYDSIYTLDPIEKMVRSLAQTPVQTSCDTPKSDARTPSNDTSVAVVVSMPLVAQYPVQTSNLDYKSVYVQADDQNLGPVSDHLDPEITTALVLVDHPINALVPVEKNKSLVARNKKPIPGWVCKMESGYVFGPLINTDFSGAEYQKSVQSENRVITSVLIQKNRTYTK